MTLKSLALVGALAVSGNANAGDICDVPGGYCKKVIECVLDTIEKDKSLKKIDAIPACHREFEHLKDDKNINWLGNPKIRIINQ